MPFERVTHSNVFYEQFGDGPDIVWVSGGGGLGSDWHAYQIPFFKKDFRNTTFDNRGIGKTTCDVPQPWPVEAFSDDAAELIRAVCDPPVAVIGLSMGSAIVQQLVLDHPDLFRVAVAMGTGANSRGWGWDYQQAEIDFRRAGGSLDGMMAVCHYAATMYPARALGDRELWPKLKADLLAWIDTGENEVSLIPQWEMSLTYDQADRLPECTVPLHVVAFQEDVQAPPQDGKEVAELAPTGEYHLFEGMGHCSIYGHTQDILNPFLKELVERYL
jgi:pimeloyl-ACP methyl ester carboxylesterase